MATLYEAGVIRANGFGCFSKCSEERIWSDIQVYKFMAYTGGVSD